MGATGSQFINPNTKSPVNTGTPIASGVTLYEQRIYCITESSWVYQWTTTTTPITTCPNNTNHTVQPGSQSIEAIQAPFTTVVDKEPANTTNRIAKAKCLQIVVQGNSSNSATISWNYNIAVYTLVLAVTPEAVGSTVTLDAGPNTAVGTTTADSPIGTTTISVSSTVLANVVPGILISLFDGVSTTQALGEATAVDPVGSTITVATATTSDFPTGSVVLTTIRVLDNLVLPISDYLPFGRDHTIARALPAHLPLTFTAVNPNSSPMTLTIYISYNY